MVLRIRDEGWRIIDRDIGYGLMDEMRGYKCGMWNERWGIYDEWPELMDDGWEIMDVGWRMRNRAKEGGPRDEGLIYGCGIWHWFANS